MTWSLTNSERTWPEYRLLSPQEARRQTAILCFVHKVKVQEGDFGELTVVPSEESK